jgi:hypothetical protein
MATSGATLLEPASPTCSRRYDGRRDVITAAVTRTIALAITTIWNFYLYKTQIFRKQSR